ncbi:hypothetical protein [Fusobacterium sp. PH5-44]|uniref:hypothetical protein n=1 Tax=unclassified Fusobacterium TaxID=2648384 RepID=UPI003D1A7EDA
MQPADYNVVNNDTIIFVVFMVIILVIIIINIVLMRWMFGIKKIIRNLELANTKLEINNELLRDIIEDINHRKVKNFEQQKIKF